MLDAIHVTRYTLNNGTTYIFGLNWILVENDDEMQKHYHQIGQNVFHSYSMTHISHLALLTTHHCWIQYTACCHFICGYAINCCFSFRKIFSNAVDIHFPFASHICWARSQWMAWNKTNIAIHWASSCLCNCLMVLMFGFLENVLLWFAYCIRFKTTIYQSQDDWYV